MEIYNSINKIQEALSKRGISKDHNNKQQGYKFRGIEDVYAAIAPLLAENKVCVFPRVIERTSVERVTKSGGLLIYTTIKAEYDFVSAIDGSKHTASTYGEAMDSADKSTNKAMSAAYKYACFQTFCIPVDGENTMDADETTPAPAPNVSNACTIDIATAKTLDDLKNVYNAYATKEPIAALKAACAKKKDEIQSCVMA